MRFDLEPSAGFGFTVLRAVGCSKDFGMWNLEFVDLGEEAVGGGGRGFFFFVFFFLGGGGGTEMIGRGIPL